MMLNMNIMTLQERVHRRSGHIAVSYTDSILVWGGFMENNIDSDSESEAPGQTPCCYHYTDEVWQYHHDTELWRRLLTSGKHPPPTCGSCGVVLGDSLYVFGGFYHGDFMYGTTNHIYKLHIPSLKWYQLHPEGQPPVSCDKLVGWAHGEKVYFFGGFGPKPTHQMGYSFELDPHTIHTSEERGWNNQLVAYDPHTNMWVWPKVGGDAPCPRAAHAADISGDKVYIFGGRFMTSRRNDLMCLDYTTMRWSVINLSSSSNLLPVPSGRSWHSFTFLTPDVAILYGGLNNANSILSDCWSIDVAEKSVNRIWKQTYQPTAVETTVGVKNLTKTPGRFWHQAVLSPRKEILSIVGGTSASATTSQMNFARGHVEEMLILEFTPKSLYRMSMDAVLKTIPVKDWYGQHVLPSTLESVLTLRLEQNPFLSQI